MVCELKQRVSIFPKPRDKSSRGEKRETVRSNENHNLFAQNIYLCAIGTHKTWQPESRIDYHVLPLKIKGIQEEKLFVSEK